jgi:hypothetical protein
MIEKQAELISKFRSENTHLHNQVDQLNARLQIKTRTEMFYLDLMKQVVENPILQSEWDRFLSFLKLAADEKYLRSSGAFTTEDAES